jgi:hypothetical protein
MLHDRFLSSSSIEDEDDRTNGKRRKGAVSSQDTVLVQYSVQCGELLELLGLFTPNANLGIPICSTQSIGAIHTVTFVRLLSIS